MRFSSHLGRGNSDAVGVAVEQNTVAFASGTFSGLDPVARAGGGPESLEETSPATVGFGAVVVAHDALDGVGGLVGVVEGNVADVVVQDVSFDDAVEDVATDETKVTVNSGSSTTGKVPNLRLVVGESRVGVLKEGDGNLGNSQQFEILR